VIPLNQRRIDMSNEEGPEDQDSGSLPVAIGLGLLGALSIGVAWAFRRHTQQAEVEAEVINLDEYREEGDAPHV
jgi:hypothetical protein